MGRHDTENQYFNRVLSIKLLLLHNLSKYFFFSTDKDSVRINKNQTLIPCPKTTSEQENLQTLVTQAFNYITINDIVKAFYNINTNKY